MRPSSSAMALLLAAARGGAGGGLLRRSASSASASASAAAAFAPHPRTFSAGGGGAGVGPSRPSKTTWEADVPTELGRRRRRRPNASDTLGARVAELKRRGAYPKADGGALNLDATVESDSEVAPTEGGTEGGGEEEEVEVVFPLMGKRVEDCPPRMRFAPSPTGSLHVGGARTALYNWLVAEKGKLDFPDGDGAFVLRVEDTDLARSTKESEESVLSDLKWLGLNWDEGPDVPLAKYGPYRQSERSSLYAAVARRLMDEDKAYPCFCTREELDDMKSQREREGLPPRYDGTWRDADPDAVSAKMEEGAPFTVRFGVPPGARVVIDDAVRGTVSWDAESTLGDFILLRSSGVPVYNFCVAVDDATMGITTVIRAEEHLTNTLRQGLILDALGAPRPRYAHCSLILGEDKQKLSKRHGATSCDQFRLDGFLPDAMINYLALLGWNDGSDNEIFARDELIDAFDLGRVVKSPSIFDMDKLRWVNSQHLKMMSIEEAAELVHDQMNRAGVLSVDDGGIKVRNFVFASTALAKQMMETTKDAVINARTVLGYNLPETFDDVTDPEARGMITDGNFYPIARAIARDFVGGTLPVPDPADPLAPFLEDINKPIEEDTKAGGTAYSYPKAYKVHMKNLSKELGVKGKNLFHPLRLSFTGEMSGQDVTKQMALLAMATGTDSPVNDESAGVVSMEERMVRLGKFCDSIPDEFRSPKTKADEKAKAARAAAEAEAEAEEGAAGAAASSPSAPDPLESYDGPPITALDVRVGRVLRVWEHDDADRLYCEEVDVGEDEPRTIASGLRPYMSASDIEGRKVLVLCNLKARRMVGFPSHGMILCASDADRTDVKFVSPPVDAEVGERVTVPDFDFDGEGGRPYAENKVGKKKVFEKLAPYLVTDEHGTPTFMGRPFKTSAGVCTSPIPGGNVS